MKNLLVKSLTGFGLLLLTMNANAQYQPRPLYPDTTQDQREADGQNRLFDRVRTDLGQVHAGTLPMSTDRSRVNLALDQLNECQRAVNSGDYDRRLFDQTISSVQRVIDLNRLTDQSRNYLVDDIRSLSRLQSQLEGY
jgi:hypothetical protein